MNHFFKYLQPTIIQATMNEELPEQVRGRFFINFNVFGIAYFTENYILGETSFGAPYLILKEDNWGLQLENTTEGELLDIPRVYIDITDKFINDPDNLFQSFVAQSLMDNKIWVKGIDNFLAGKDYYTNNTLYNYLALTDQIEVPDFSVRLPDYLDTFGQLRTEYWKPLTGELYEDYNNLEYFNEKNNMLTNKFSEDELNNFYSTFCSIILKYTKITDNLLIDSRNQIYSLVLNYFKNFKSDEGSNALSLILNSGYSTITTTTSTSCSCNSGSKTTELTPSCYDLYSTAMYKWLGIMLSDSKFYEDWFRIYKSEDDYIPNDVLIETLNIFFDEFINMQHILNFIKSSSVKCECPSPVSFNENECNYNILKNYKKIFDWVFNEEIDSNVNKIKIFGGQFAELLPKLQF